MKIQAAARLKLLRELAEHRRVVGAPLSLLALEQVRAHAHGEVAVDREVLQHEVDLGWQCRGGGRRTATTPW